MMVNDRDTTCTSRNTQTTTPEGVSIWLERWKREGPVLCFMILSLIDPKTIVRPRAEA
jgi:hypothetical protein